LKIDGKAYRTMGRAGPHAVETIDQTRLPHELVFRRIDTLQGAVDAIATMVVRGAPLIGATAAYGLALGLHQAADDAHMADAYAKLLASRPTAVNLRHALEDVRAVVAPLPPAARAEAAFARADAICEEDVALNLAIGEAGFTLIEAAHKRTGRTVNVLTHCNAGWLATVDWGTATAPIYLAHDRGVPVHVWVDETRPRNQGASLTAFELGQHGVPHTLVVDNAGGHLMQRGLVDMCIVGTDRVTARGDVANKIGTYLKALAARAHNVPFYVALPGPTLDWRLDDGLAIEIEERSSREVTHIWGRLEDGRVAEVQIAPMGTKAANPAFDVTPAELVTAFITERGVVAAERRALAALYGRE
jgi:methylthioribose-1-phosphate isomerase